MSVDRRTLPIPDPPPGIRFPDLTESQLAPGVRLVTVERNELPLVSLLWLWHAGTSADTDAAPGLAALTADLLDEGTASLTMTELHEALAGIGGQLDTDIGHDATVLSMLALSAHRERAIELFMDMAERPRLDASDMARVQVLAPPQLPRQESPRLSLPMVLAPALAPAPGSRSSPRLTQSRESRGRGCWTAPPGRRLSRG